MTQAGILRHLVNQAVLRRGLPPLPAPSTVSYAEVEEAVANEEVVSRKSSLICPKVRRGFCDPRALLLTVSDP